MLSGRVLSAALVLSGCVPRPMRQNFARAIRPHASKVIGFDASCDGPQTGLRAIFNQKRLESGAAEPPMPAIAVSEPPPR
jgi:hypothetical protein